MGHFRPFLFLNSLIKFTQILPFTSQHDTAVTQGRCHMPQCHLRVINITMMTQSPGDTRDFLFFFYFSSISATFLRNFSVQTMTRRCPLIHSLPVTYQFFQTESLILGLKGSLQTPPLKLCVCALTSLVHSDVHTRM